MQTQNLTEKLKSFLQGPYVLSLLFSVINALIYGYEYGNNSYQDYILPYIHKIIDPSLYPRDVYLTTLNFFPSVYIYLIALLGKFFPLEAVHASIYFFLKYLFFIAVYQLADVLFQNRRTSLLSLFLFALSPLVNSFGLLGDEPVMKFLLYQTTFVVPFLLISIYLFLRNKFVPSFLLLGALFYFNGLLSVYVTVMFFAATWITLKSNEDTALKKSLLFSWLIFLVMILPYVSASVFKLPWGNPSGDFFLLLKNYYAGHTFALTWTAAKWQRILSFIVLFFVIFRQFKGDKNKSIINAFLAAMIIMWLIAFVFSELIPSRFITVLMLYRSDIFFVAFVILFAAAYIQRLLSSKTQPDLLAAFLLMLIICDLNLFFSPILLVIALTFVLFLLERTFNEKPRSLFLKTFISLVYIIYLAIVAALSSKFFTYFPGQIMSYLFICLIAAGFIVLQTNLNFTKKSVSDIPFFYILMFLSLCIYFNIIQYRLSTGTLAYKSQIKSDWKDAQLWVKSNTPKEAALIVPPFMNGFRAFSQRSVFVEKLDGGAMLWAPGFEVEWSKRLNLLGYEKVPKLEFQAFNQNDPLTVKTRLTYASVDENTLVKLSKNYGASLVVEENLRALSFPLIYQNKSFSIYKIPLP